MLLDAAGHLGSVDFLLEMLVVCFGLLFCLIVAMSDSIYLVGNQANRCKTEDALCYFIVGTLLVLPLTPAMPA
jgi:hypothetical protein